MTLLHRAETRPMTLAPRVGFCGLLGAGNLGNDGSLEAMLAYLLAEHPDAIVDCMSTRLGQVTARYGIPAVQLPIVKCVKIPMAMIVDAFRTASWVRRHDLVIVLGMGATVAVATPSLLSGRPEKVRQ